MEINTTLKVELEVWTEITVYLLDVRQNGLLLLLLWSTLALANQ